MEKAEGFAVMILVGLISMSVANKLMIQISKQKKFKTFVRWIIFVLFNIIAWATWYFSSFIYEYDGKIGLHPYELPLKHPIFVYAIWGAAFGFFTTFGIRALENKEEP